MRAKVFVDRLGSAGSPEPGGRRQPALSASQRWLQISLLLLCVGLVPGVRADVLADCRALSVEEDDVHVCLDNFLDDLDDSMELLSDQVYEAVDDIAGALFRRSQAAFVEYRRQNCLWYVSFSGPRTIAEQLGKNCLVDMTRERLAELRALLVASEQSVGRLQGYYAYGADLNAFIACGSGRRYRVDSDNDAAAELQQRYLALATADRQLLYVDLRGELNDGTGTNDRAAGTATIDGIAAVRVPLESDCPMPSSPGVAATVLAAEEGAAGQQAVTSEDATTGGAADERAPEEEPEQQLNAFFGAWQAACMQIRERYLCDLSVGLEGATDRPEQPVQLRLERLADGQTTVELRFDGVEIDSPARIRWSVDDKNFGAIAFSVVRVDEQATRQIIADPDFLQRELLPALTGGTQVTVEVVAAEDDVSGERFGGTLIGLSRALEFADDFIDGSSS